MIVCACRLSHVYFSSAPPHVESTSRAPLRNLNAYYHCQVSCKYVFIIVDSVFTQSVSNARTRREVNSRLVRSHSATMSDNNDSSVDNLTRVVNVIKVRNLRTVPFFLFFVFFPFHSTVFSSRPLSTTSSCSRDRTNVIRRSFSSFWRHSFWAPPFGV